MAEKLRSLIASSRADSGAKSKASPPQHPKTLRSRLANAWPVLLLLAFLLLLWALFGDRLSRARTVELAPVVTLHAAEPTAGTGAPSEASAGDRYEAATLFQASGWVEAAPFPIRATALINGTVDAVHVLQGDPVHKGQILATLVDDDARLDLETARSALGQSEAKLKESRAMAQAVASALETLELEVAVATARLEELRDEAERLSTIGSDAVPAREISQAKLKVRSQEAAIVALQAKAAELNAQLEARHAQSLLAAHQVALAGTEVDRKQLALDRTRIQSPVDGIVQRLHVAPGMKRMLDMDDPESATIATLYQPGQLQARIDVPLEAAARLSVGQAVRLRSSLFQDRQFNGTVTQIEGQADLQRNTLQAKVAIHEPDPKLRPEMLCRAEFLTVPAGGGGDAPAGVSLGVDLYVPEAAIMPGSGPPAVWKIDASGERIERQTIRTTGAPREGHLLVVAGLKPGDRVVTNPAADLEAGERVAAAKEL